MPRLSSCGDQLVFDKEVSPPRPDNLSHDLSVLQWAQLNHDNTYHKDVTALSPIDRMKHMTLHFSKYIGNMVELIDEPNQSKFARITVDIFIICLASANTLNINLASALKVRFGSSSGNL